MTYRPAADQGFEVVRENEAWRIEGRGIELLVARHDLSNYEALSYLEDRLREIGVIAALERGGLRAGGRRADRRGGVRAPPGLTRGRTYNRHAMTVVAKLGSSIVAEASGDVRGDVLDGVCAQVGELHAGGEDVVMVTSGAIALGMKLMGFDARPRAVDELQAASAVGQGSLFRAYESRLASHDVHAAQVLLNSSDVSTRVNYLNARATLRRLLQWRCVPVINENDTTATDEITFGDNDFLAAQVALLLGARQLVLLTDTAGLHTADPRHHADATLVERVDDFSELEGLEIGDRTSVFGSGGMRARSRLPRWRRRRGSRRWSVTARLPTV